MKTRHCIIAFFLMLAGATAHAQDTLVMRDSRELAVKVIEIDDSKIFYRKQDNPDGPLYSCRQNEVFMVIYRGGKREMFTAANPGKNMPAATTAAEPPAVFSMANASFRIQLTSFRLASSKNGKFKSASGEVTVYSNNQFFATVSFSASQKENADFDFTRPTRGSLAQSSISMVISSPQMKEYLFEKFENYTGAGLGWVPSPGLFSNNPAQPCQVAFLKKPRQNETDAWWLQGKLSFEKYTLQSCQTVEERMLSMVLLWLDKNFTAANNAGAQRN